MLQCLVYKVFVLLLKKREKERTKKEVPVVQKKSSS
jgi:hypothetical protein